MQPAVADLLDLLEVQAQGQGVFTGRPSSDPLPRVFGGQLLAQALAAACFSVPEGSSCHSLHAYFLRPGKPGRPIDYEVAVMRDGQQFAARKVMAVQRDELVFELTASFATESTGPSYAEPMRETAAPETFPPEAERMAKLIDSLPQFRRAFYERVLPIEFITVDERGADHSQRDSAPIRTWMRVRDGLPDADSLQRVLLAYASDMVVLEPALRAVGASHFDPELAIASLDHALWFHRPFRFDDWLLFTVFPVSVASGRGLCRGLVHDRAGQHVASVTQEVLLRPRTSTVTD